MPEDKKTDAKPATAANDVLAQVIDRIKAKENILVALSKNPSVDEMTAALGLTLMLDKVGKYATAIFSGQVPNALVFLGPDKTFEKNTDSLQDFIIALDKTKADHLRYKVEGDYVKIYITPYRTTLSEGDLEFSHGEFNVNLVIALNVATPSDLDGALSEYGRIMHDAGSINITAGAPGKFGDFEWADPSASSVSEMVALLGQRMEEKPGEMIDKQVATVLLTGIVANTNRFSNERTTPQTMGLASKLMELGADQLLISSNIEAEGNASAPVEAPLSVKSNDSAMETGAPVANESMPIETAPLPAESEPMRETATPTRVPTISEILGTAMPALPPVETPSVPEPPTAVEVPAPVELPVMPQPEIKTPEEQLEALTQTPAAAQSSSPLMDELRQAAGEDLDPDDLSVRGMPKKDYSAMIEEELKTPIGQDNPATVVAPETPSAPEVNDVPEIKYGAATENPPDVAVPAPPQTTAAPVAPVQAEEPAAPVWADNPRPTPLSFPAQSEAVLPPPPPPPVSPVEAPPTMPIPETTPAPTPVAVAAPVMPVVAAIQPAGPTSEPEPTYLGSNPAMQDQVYPATANDPGAFRLPG